MKKIRILHFELSSHIGGIERFLVNLYSSMNRNEIQFDFVTIADEPALGTVLEEMGGTVHHVAPYRHVFRYMTQVRKILKQEYDVVHIHKNSAVNIIPVIMAALCSRSKIVVHAHNTAPSIGKSVRFLHFLNRWLLVRLTDVQLACSAVAGEWMFGKKAKGRVQLIPNGVIAEQFLFREEERRRMRMELQIPENALVTGTVGRFTQQKNYPFLLELFAEILRKRPDAWLVLAGDGELQTAMKQYAAELGVESRVKFLGACGKVPELLCAMDVFLMPSLYEGLPIAAIEAQASGLILFLAETISRECRITDQINWFPLNMDKEKLAEDVIVAVKENSFRRRQEDNRQVKKSDYGMEKTCSRIEEVYRQ